MADLFQKKYRIPSSRLQTYDYGSQGMYFVTICTKFMQHFFGKIITDTQTKKAKLEATEIGKIPETEWYKSLKIRPDMNLDIDEFIMMPNHIHGIIIIGNNEYNSGDNFSELNSDLNSKSDLNSDSNLYLHLHSNSHLHPHLHSNSHLHSSRDAMHRVSTQSISKNAFAPQSKNLASIMRGYKSAVTTYARKNNIKFEWHVRYHDHIIRNEEEYLRISNYIRNNPSKWLDDKFNNSK